MSSSLSARVATPSQEGPLKTTHESQHQTEVPSHALGAEMRRSKQHRMLKLALNSLYWPVDDVRSVLAARSGEQIRILDIGSASGAWATEMAAEFPHAEVVGIDIIPTESSNSLSNCSFQKLDIMGDPEAANLLGKFDFVHARLVSGGISDYNAFIARAISLVRPGGIVCFVEPHILLYDENDALIPEASDSQPTGAGSWFVKLYKAAWSQIQNRYQDDRENLWSFMPELVKGDQSVQNVRSRILRVPVGWGGSNDNDVENKEEVGRLLGESMIETSDVYRPLISGSGVTDDEIARWTEEMAADVKDLRIKAYMRFAYCTATIQ